MVVGWYDFHNKVEILYRLVQRKFLKVFPESRDFMRVGMHNSSVLVHKRMEKMEIYDEEEQISRDLIKFYDL